MSCSTSHHNTESSTMVKSSFSSLSLLHSGSGSSEDLSTCSSPSTLSETSTEESLPHSGQALELELDSGSTQLTVSFKEKNVLAWMRAHRKSHNRQLGRILLYNDT
ncbi:hypothetical protein BT96DRAFT_917925 [Gymnopus androsaceus JB14]|uniref:Uncharacterized protein n=1 Tax=Gymnopus androsaceus JB14 TaxID=1447944 RepID=A0A6A4HX78_9AGAR|nr:hypothetical protein BT96DRAFT_917925 [Gymnopus androsaceus JB14]